MRHRGVAPEAEIAGVRIDSSEHFCFSKTFSNVRRGNFLFEGSV
jgi:hypothetical protein